VHVRVIACDDSERHRRLCRQINGSAYIVGVCAEAPEEARELDLPLLDQVLSQLSAGKELRPNGDSLYELFQDGQCVAMLEILEAPCLGVP
jgi:hypothetical protein